MQLNILGLVLVRLFDLTLQSRRPTHYGLQASCRVADTTLDAALFELERRGMVETCPLRLTMGGLAVAATLSREDRRSALMRPHTLAA